jgi:hypothetical protein
MRGALVVHDISAFSGPEQDRMLGWLDDQQYMNWR